MLHAEGQKFLMPGELVFTNETIRLNTLLGSCVAITLWHPVRKIGGMCHYLLPARKMNSNETLTGRYAEDVMKIFMQEISKYHTRPKDYQVKVFGAGTMVANNRVSCMDEAPSFVQCQYQCRNVPCQNRKAAINLTCQYGFYVSHYDLGGTAFRRIEFNLADGSVLVNGRPDISSDRASGYV